MIYIYIKELHHPPFDGDNEDDDDANEGVVHSALV